MAKAKKKKKKYSNTPKNNLSYFIYFNKEVRAKLKADDDFWIITRLNGV